MKKIIAISVLAAFAVVGCKKKQDPVSQIVTKSVPTITITGQRYVSLHVGDVLPAFTATAYDSFYHESCTVLFDQAGFDNTTPGLYVISASAKNHYGFVGIEQIYVAVTEIPDALDLTGYYFRLGDPNRVAFVTKLGRGLFMTSNVGGVDTGDVANTGPIISAVFAVTDPTMLTFGSQKVLDNGSFADLSSFSESLVMSATPPDTTLNYGINESSFGTQVRSFVKQ